MASSATRCWSDCRLHSSRDDRPKPIIPGARTSCPPLVEAGEPVAGETPAVPAETKSHERNSNMKRNFLGAAISVLAILLLAPPCRATRPSSSAHKPEDSTVSLDLKFTKKKQNAMQRIFSFLDYGPNGFATGFLVGDGLVITAYHAVSGNLSDTKKVQLGFA